MTTPASTNQLALDPDEEGIDEEESRRRRIERNRSLITLLDQWIAEGENATEEERRKPSRNGRSFSETSSRFGFVSTSTSRDPDRCAGLRSAGIVGFAIAASDCVALPPLVSIAGGSGHPVCRPGDR